MDGITKFDPRTAIKLYLAVIFFAWQSIATIFGFILYLLIVQLVKNRKWTVPILGIGAFIFIALYLQNLYHLNIFTKFFINGFTANENFWYLLKSHNVLGALSTFFSNNSESILGITFLIVGVFGMVDAVIISLHSEKS